MISIKEDKKKVLIIDDEKYIAKALYLLLKNDFKLEYSPSAKKALERIQSKEYDAIILDMKMSEMDGVEFAQELKKQDHSEQIVILTAYPGEYIEDEIMEKTSAIDYIVKTNLKDITRIKTSIKIATTVTNLVKKLKMEIINRELEEKSKAEAIQQLSRGFAHEINNANSVIDSSISRISEGFNYFLEAEKIKIKQIFSDDIFDKYLQILDNIINTQKIYLSLEEKIELEKKYGEIARYAFDYNSIKDIEKLKFLFENDKNEIIGKSFENIYNFYKSINLLSKAKERIKSTVKAVKDITAMDTGEITKININECLDEVVDLLYIGERRGVELIRIYNNLPEIYANKRQVSEALLNIIKNSFEALNNKGKIEIRTEYKQDHIIINIIDNGPGIKKEELEKIFNPFYTTKIGTNFGIGLYISKKYIEVNKGTIKATSKKGETNFEIIFPVMIK